MKRRSLGRVGIVAVLAMSVALASTSLLPAATRGEGEKTFPSEKRSVAYVTRSIDVQNGEFRSIPGLEDLEILNRGTVTASISADIVGGPVDIRIVERGGGPLLPGVAHFAPTPDSSSFSYQFLDRGSSEAACRTYAAQWRSQDATEATLRHAVLVLDYRFDDRTRRGLKLACPD